MIADDLTTLLVADDGSPVALHDLGGSGVPALFVHATGFHGRTWGPIANRLADCTHSWAVDLRGHGDSGDCPKPVDWLAFGHDVHAAASRIGTPLLGVGHSLGGASLLMTEMAHPGTFSQLVIYEPAVSPPDLVQRGVRALYAGVARSRRATFGSRAEALENFLSKQPTRTIAADILAAYVEYGFVDEPGGVRIKCAPATESAIYEAAGPGQVYDSLNVPGCPVTLIRGSRSDVWDLPAAQMVAARLGARLLTVDGGGHFTPLEDVSTFAGIVRDAVLG